MRNGIRYLISFVLAAGLLWFVFKDIDLASMRDRLAAADWRWLWVSAILTLVAHFFRAWRWAMLLKPLQNNVTVYESFISLLTGYFANYILPRMGEVTRCGTLYKMSGVPVNQSLGTVIADRIFDVAVLLILLVVNFLLEFDRLSMFFADLVGSKTGGGEESTNLLAIILVSGLVIFVSSGLAIWRSPILRERLMSIGIVAKIVGFAEGMVNGLVSVRKVDSPALFVLSTIGIWVCYFFSSYSLFYCIPETSDLGLLAGLTLLVIGAVGMTAPTQGGIGAYHLLVGNVMVLYGLTQQDGITLATFVHGSQMVLMLFVGAIAFLLALFYRKKEGVSEPVSEIYKGDLKSNS